MCKLAWLPAVLGALWLCPAALQAQDEERPRDNPETRREEDPYAWVDRLVDRIADRAELSEEEAGVIKERLRKLMKEMDDLRRSAEEDLKKSLGEERFSEIERFLRRFLESPRRRGPQGRIGRILDRIVERAKDELGLTEEQLEKVKEMSEKTMERLREALREARESGPEGFREMRDRFREEIENFVERFKELLSKEQQEKLDRMMEDMRNRFRGRGPGRDRERRDEGEEREDDY